MINFVYEFRGPANRGQPRWMRELESDEEELDDVENRVAEYEKEVKSKPISGNAPCWLPGHAERHVATQMFVSRNDDELGFNVGETIYKKAKHMH